MQAQFNLILMAYHHDHLSYFLPPNFEPDHTTISLPGNINQIMAPQLTTTLGLKSHIIKPDQLILLSPIPTQSLTTLTIPILLLLTPTQATTLVTPPITYPGNFYHQATLPNQLPLSTRQLLTHARQSLADLTRITALQHLHYLLPPRFTTKQLANLLTHLLKTRVKRNNINRDFKEQLQPIGKDHTHVGYPATLFKYRPATASLTPPKFNRRHRV